jgi:hypothetical protein
MVVPLRTDLSTTRKHARSQTSRCGSPERGDAVQGYERVATIRPGPSFSTVHLSKLMRSGAALETQRCGVRMGHSGDASAFTAGISRVCIEFKKKHVFNQ